MPAVSSSHTHEAGLSEGTLTTPCLHGHTAISLKFHVFFTEYLEGAYILLPDLYPAV